MPNLSRQTPARDGAAMTIKDDKSSRTTAHLEHITLGIISSLNARCIDAPFTQHATTDYIYHHPSPTGEVTPYNVTETQKLLHWQFIENDPKVIIEASSVATRVDERGEYATVWGW
ncbi:hypothetical protein PRZ48_014918 [Zasmidium cellare]|uniref:SnoaL-like domain-containing protein n=1 Tax=Zasmidium cellare TaxID=395010 RepID=A0ABR0DXK4_ZASCE|nr:hypothetical protein PRZ48_014918 [Zasmidium cellare]